MIIDFNVKNQIITRNDKNNTVKLSENYLELKFTFNSEWNDFSKFIVIKNKDTEPSRIALTNDKVIIPSEFLNTDSLIFSLYGVLEEENDDTLTRITTNIISLKLLNTVYTGEFTDVIDRSETDLVEEIYGAINSKADAVETTTALESKSDVGHTHIKEDITDFNHNHDDRYYTETETDTLLDAKSDNGHTHTESDITDLGDYSVVGHTHPESDIIINNRIIAEYDTVNDRFLATLIVNGEETSNYAVNIVNPTTQKPKTMEFDSTINRYTISRSQLLNFALIVFIVCPELQIVSPPLSNANV